jgi:hypothetical protein
VKRVYGIAGDSLNGITDVIRTDKRIKWIHVRHEETAAFAAGAEAHLTGTLSVCAGSCGPGNLHLVKEYTDKISGAMAKRPGLDQLMADARHGRFQVVVVWAFDRLARSVRHFLEVLDELNHIKVEFVSFREISTRADRWGGRWW